MNPTTFLQEMIEEQEKAMASTEERRKRIKAEVKTYPDREPKPEFSKGRETEEHYRWRIKKLWKAEGML